MKEICVLTFLGINAWTDLRKKQISLTAVGIFSAAAIARAFYAGELSWMLLIPAGVCVFFLAVSMITRGALGMGDCWLIAALGLMLNTEEFLVVLMAGMLCCAVCAGLLLTVFRKKRNTEIPFVPFLLLGYIGGVLLWK